MVLWSFKTNLDFDATDPAARTVFPVGRKVPMASDQLNLENKRITEASHYYRIAFVITCSLELSIVCPEPESLVQAFINFSL